MKKEDVLQHLKKAKNAHTKLVQKAKILIDNIDIEEATKPVEPSQSDFGKWFLSDGKKLSGLSNNPLACMENIESLHHGIHEMYSNIYTIYRGDSKKAGFFSKMMGSGNKPASDEERTIALEHYEKMQKISNDLEAEINRLERRLGAIADEKIEALL